MEWEAHSWTLTTFPHSNEAFNELSDISKSTSSHSSAPTPVVLSRLRDIGNENFSKVFLDLAPDLFN